MKIIILYFLIFLSIVKTNFLYLHLLLKAVQSIFCRLYEILLSNLKCYVIIKPHIKEENTLMILAISIISMIIILTLLTINIVLLAKKKRSKAFGIISLILSIFAIFITPGAISISLPIGEKASINVSTILFIIDTLLSIINIVFSCIILPKGSDEKQVKQVEIEKPHCTECNCEAEEISKNFANTTERAKLRVGNRQWFDIYTTYNITYKCPKCGKTWTENKKEKTGKKLKKYDQITKTWVEYDDVLF